MGDTLLAVPALRALRRCFRQPLRLAAHGETARLLASLGEVDEGFAFDDARLQWLFRPAQVRPDEPVVAWLDPSRVPELRDAMLIAPSRPPALDRHCAQHLVESLVRLGCEAEVDAHPLRVQAVASDVVLVHPGSGSAAKNWPPTCFATVIKRLGADRVTLIVGEADADAADRVERNVGQALKRLSAPPLSELAARLAGCRAYLGNDSGVSHLAGLCGAKTVVLFGPSRASVWRPLGPHVRVLDFDAAPEHVARLLT